MKQVDDLSRSLAEFDQHSTVVAVIELSNASWLVAGTLPGVARRPLKKLEPDPAALAQLLERWRSEAVGKGRSIDRLVVACEAGRDGFWLARWLQARGIEVHVIHPTSVAVSREHRRSKTDRLDAGMLMRVFLGWLRGECQSACPTQRLSPPLRSVPSPQISAMRLKEVAPRMGRPALAWPMRTS